MRRVVLAILGFCVLFTISASAEEWSKTFAITGKPELRVETSDASIQVETWDQNKIEARVTTERYKIGEGGIKVLDHQNGDSVDLEVRYPHNINFMGMGRGRVEIEIHMPREGRVNLHTGDGSIRLSEFKGDVEVDSGDGHQDLDGLQGTLRARAGDGHIRAAGRFDGLELTTGDGSIEARALPGSAVSSIWSLRTGDGSVDLQVPESLAASVDLHTGDGHITFDLPVTVEGKSSRSEIQGKLNGGGNPIRIHTGDGSIHLEKL